MSNIPETGRTSRVRIRLVVIQILVFSLLLTLGGRLWYLQIRNGQEYSAEAKNNHVQQVVQPAVRGSIVDARGVPIADNETKLVVSANRTDLMKMSDNGKAVLTRLAGVLGMKPADVIAKVRLCDAKTPKPCWNGSPYQPIPVTEDATTQQALQIRERTEDFPGITAEPTAVRSYPGTGGLNAAQVLGYLGPVTDKEVAKSNKTDNPLLRSDQVGRAGLESMYDQQLRGKSGVTRYEVDNLGRVIGKAGQTASQPGSSLVTSIDSRVQALTEKELDAAMKALRKTYDSVTHTNYKADSGAAVVMDVHTGQVIAMASAPTYNPNVWSGGISAKNYDKLTKTSSNYPLLNRAIQGQSAPGSTFKVISTSAAINAGYAPDGGYPCTSSMTIGNREFKNFEGENYGDISLGKALEVSCDTVFYHVAYDQWKKDGGNNPKHPKDWFFKTAHEFGLGKKTGIDLPNELAGRVPDREWKKAYWEANKDLWCKQGKKNGTYVEQIEYENCTDGKQIRAGDSVNYAIGQGDTLLTPVQGGGDLLGARQRRHDVPAERRQGDRQRRRQEGPADQAQEHRQAPRHQVDRLVHQQGPGRRRHQRYGCLAVRRLAAGQDHPARQDRHRGGRRQADHRVAVHVHQGLRDHHDDLPGWYRFRCRGTRGPQDLRGDVRHRQGRQAESQEGAHAEAGDVPAEDQQGRCDRLAQDHTAQARPVAACALALLVGRAGDRGRTGQKGLGPWVVSP